MDYQKNSSSPENEAGEQPPGSLSINNKKEDSGPLFKTGSFLVGQKNNSQVTKLQNIFSPQSLKNALPLALTDSYQTEYSEFLKNLDIEIVSDVKRCFELWEEFSPKKSLFDTWEFRLAFFLAYKPKLHFILLKNKSENLALLPLCYEEDKKKYFWFGSAWQEENKFFVKKSIFIPLLLAFAPCPILLNAIIIDDTSLDKQFTEDFKPDDSKYILDLKNIQSSEDFLMRLKKNRRHDLRKDRRRIEKQNPQIIINNFSDFDNLVKISTERFKQKGEKADWKDPRRVEAFRQVIRLGGKSYKMRMITVRVGKKVAGVDLIALFNDCYHTLKCGYDVKNFSGIGNFVNLFEIQDAICLGMKKIDFLQNSYQWKDRWFEEVLLVKYEK